MGIRNLNEISRIQDLITRQIRKLKIGRLPLVLYGMTREVMVHSTVDFIIIRDNFDTQESEFMLIERIGASYEGKWFFGGRQMRGETIDVALTRVMLHEAKLRQSQIVSCRFSHHQDLYSPEHPSPEGVLPPAHHLMHVYVIKVKPDFKPSPDGTWRNPEWYTKETVPTSELRPELILALMKAGLID